MTAEEPFDEPVQSEVPTMNQQLEAMRSGIAIVRLTDVADVGGILRYWSGLDDHERGYCIGALGQLALVGCHVMAAMGGRTLDGELSRMEQELVEAIKDGQG